MRHFLFQKDQTTCFTSLGPLSLPLLLAGDNPFGSFDRVFNTFWILFSRQETRTEDVTYQIQRLPSF